VAFGVEWEGSVPAKLLALAVAVIVGVAVDRLARPPLRGRFAQQLQAAKAELEASTQQPQDTEGS
jgi:uncharacterized membrane-anchored protein YhcB (DUF1043 family)